MLHFSAFGVPLEIVLERPGLRAALEPLLPPGRTPTDEPAVATFTLSDEAQIGALDAALRHCIASNAPDHVFVHAGVVGAAGRALVLPSPTHGGKSELVAALLRAGADYGSDEFAVLDEHGLVHPYPRPLSLRRPEPADLPPAAFGARVVDAPLPVAAIAFTRYEEGAAWSPHELSAAGAALRLLEHAGQARAAPARVLAALHAAADGAVVVEGPRGEAAAAAPALLALLG